MNVHITSRGLDPARLAEGRDLVLAIDPRHGVTLPSGVLAHDHLPLGQRFRIDALALEALARWRDVYGAALTVDGMALPEIWTFELYEAINQCLVAGLGLRAAVRAYGPPVLRLMDAHPLTEQAAVAAGQATGVPVVAASHRRPPAIRAWAPAVPAARRARGAAVRAASRWGVASTLKPGSTLFLSYWPLMPLLDRMLDDPSSRPALSIEHRPAHPARSLRSARQGGWLGVASRDDVAEAGERAARVLAPLAEPAAIDVDGLPAGGVIHGVALGVAHGRAGRDLAALAVARQAFATGHVRRVIGNNDLEPSARLVLSVARDAGVPTFCLAHGACLLPQPMADLELSDEVALWSPAIAPPISNRDRPIHVVGYPLPHDPVRTRRFAGGRLPRVALLAQSGTPSTATVDDRIVMRHYVEGLAGIAESLPGATVVLRPHPSHGPLPLASLSARFPALELRLDRSSDLRRCLATSDACVGGTSAATLEAALFGTPVVVLNVTGFDWRRPLGGESTVPVARSAAELAECLDRWRRLGTLPGGEELLEALGADGGDATERLVAALGGRPPRPVSLAGLEWPAHMRGAAPTSAPRTERAPSDVAAS
jgi:hypothetical protein